MKYSALNLKYLVILRYKLIDMKVHTTNYYNTFICISPDCLIENGTIPPLKKAGKTVANHQFDLIYSHPYQYNSDEILFKIYAERNGIAHSDLEEAKSEFFSKGQACFRASPLTKNYGWGVHFDEEGKMAIYPQESEEYQQFLKDDSLKIINAMRSSKK